MLMSPQCNDSSPVIYIELVGFFYFKVFVISAITSMYFEIPKYFSKQIKEAWNPHKSVQKNMKLMGLSSNPNVTFKIPSAKVSFSCIKTVLY